MSSIQPGDVVVCVDVSTPNMSGQRLAHKVLRLGAMYRVSSARIGNTGRPSVSLAGVAPPDGKMGFHAFRFRKIDTADERFTEQVRACRPIKRREPA